MSARLQTTELASLLSGTAENWEIHYLETVDSTNSWARQEARQGARDGGIYLTDYQSAGRGRRGRAWEVPAGTSVMFSILLKPDTAPENLSMLTLVMGLSVAQGISLETGLETGIKWPNDVVVNGKKICGILTELDTVSGSVIIGTGININMTSFPEELREKATSIAAETGRSWSREQTAGRVIAAFAENYRIFNRTGDMIGLKESYQKILVNRGNKVRVLDPRAPFTGTALGIDDRGELLVKREDTGSVETVFSGEVSVRGIYGYAV